MEKESSRMKTRCLTAILCALLLATAAHGSGGSLKPSSKISKSGDPIYLVSGGAGAPLDSCPEDAETTCSKSFHYLVFEVNGKKVDAKVVIIPAKLKKA